MFKSAMYFNFRTNFAFVFSFLFLFNILSATNFYIDSKSGNDSYNGQAPEAGEGNQGPWRSMTKMVDFSYEPGDSILFRRGGEWSGVTLKVPRSGEEGAHIYYGAYGTGNKPVIDNAEINIDAHYIIVENFISLNSPTNGVARKTGTHIEIKNIEIYNAGANGIRIVGYGYSGNEEVLVEGCTVERARVDGITIHKGADYAQAGSKFVFRNNHCSLMGEQGFDLTTGSNILLENNSSNDNPAGSIVCGRGVKEVVIKKHFSLNDDYALNLSRCEDVKIEYSIFVGNNRLLRTDTNADGGSPSNLLLVNNVFWQTGTKEVGRFNYSDGPITFKNNVFGGSPSNAFFYFKNSETPASKGNYTFDNNVYYNTEVEGNNPDVVNLDGSEYSFDLFKKQFGQESQGIVTDPKFPNSSGTYELPLDYEISINSGLVDKGEIVGSIEDFAGNAVPQGGVPDIGAFEVVLENFLPVEWNNVEAIQDLNKPIINISWSTSMEINNQYFTVERSYDRNIFEQIGSVSSQGDGAELKTYELEDAAPVAGVMYYRVKQVDIDGQFSYSPLTRVEFSENSYRQINFYPSLTNPGQKLTITHGQVENSLMEIKLVDLHGKVISNKTQVANSFQSYFEIPSHITPGYYFLTVALDDDYKGFRVKIQ